MADEARVTQEGEEIAYSSPSDASVRVTQEGVEMAYISPSDMPIRVTSQGIEVAYMEIRRRHSAVSVC